MTEPAWLTAARKDLGLKEIVGSRHEPRIVAYFAKAGHAWVKDDETAWCAAFVGAKLVEAGLKGTGSLMARSYSTWGQPLKTPTPGCIAVFSRAGSPVLGHVAFFLRDLGSQIEVIGGNQSNSVSIARYSKSNLIGYRYPAGVAIEVGGPGKPAAARPVLELGDEGDDVETWQAGLNTLGAKPPLVVDGDFGPKTRDATMAFQRSKNLLVDSVVNEPDWVALDVALEALG